METLVWTPGANFLFSQLASRLFSCASGAALGGYDRLGDTAEGLRLKSKAPTLWSTTDRSGRRN